MLTVTGQHLGLRLMAVAGDVNAGILHGGVHSTNSNAFTRYEATTTAIALIELTVTGGAPFTTNAAIIGDGDSGIVNGGYSGNISATDKFTRYVRTGTDLVTTELTIEGVDVPGASNCKFIGTTTEGILFNPNVAYLLHYSISGDTATTSIVNNGDSFFRLSGVAIVGTTTSALWLGRDANRLLVAQSSAVDNSEAGVKNADTIIAAGIASGDVLAISVIGGATLSMQFNADDIGQSAETRTRIQSQYGGGALTAYLLAGNLIAQRSSSIDALNKVRVYRF